MHSHIRCTCCHHIYVVGETVDVATWLCPTCRGVYEVRVLEAALQMVCAVPVR